MSLSCKQRHLGRGRGRATVVGFVIDAHGPRFGYGVAALCGAACAATCLAGLDRLLAVEVPAPAGSSPSVRRINRYDVTSWRSGPHQCDIVAVVPR